MRLLDTFAGIGGFSLAAHWMGWETAAFIEWDGFCQKVLAKNFPNIPIFGDIKDFQYEQQRERIGSIDIVCGGFPCQPFSHAGKRKGRDDERHLWPEMLRVIRETQPAFVVGENVAGLVSMDGGDLLEEILLDLESEGYEVQPFIVPAISVGAPHRRDRIWIVARNIGNTESKRKEAIQRICTGQEANADRGYEFNSSNTSSQQNDRAIYEQRGNEKCGRYALDDGEETTQQSGATETNHTCGLRGVFLTTSNAECSRQQGQGRNGYSCNASQGGERQANWPLCHNNFKRGWYEVATRFCRVDDGLSGGVDIVGATDNRTQRLKALGNSIVPQVAYQLFRAIEETYLK